MNEPDFTDVLIPVIVVGNVIAAWVWLYLHPSDAAYGICVGAVVGNVGIYHLLRVKDDKQPDSR